MIGDSQQKLYALFEEVGARDAIDAVLNHEPDIYTYPGAYAFLAKAGVDYRSLGNRIIQKTGVGPELWLGWLDDYLMKQNARAAAEHLKRSWGQP